MCIDVRCISTRTNRYEWTFQRGVHIPDTGPNSLPFVGDVFLELIISKKDCPLFSLRVPSFFCGSLVATQGG